MDMGAGEALIRRGEATFSAKVGDGDEEGRTDTSVGGVDDSTVGDDEGGGKDRFVPVLDDTGVAERAARPEVMVSSDVDDATEGDVSFGGRGDVGMFRSVGVVSKTVGVGGTFAHTMSRRMEGCP